MMVQPINVDPRPPYPPQTLCSFLKTQMKKNHPESFQILYCLICLILIENKDIVCVIDNIIDLSNDLRNDLILKNESMYKQT